MSNNEEKKLGVNLTPKHEQVHQQQSTYERLRRGLFGGMLAAEGLSEKEIDDTLKNKETFAHDDLNYTEEHFDEMNTPEYKAWEAEQELAKSIREKAKNK